MGQAQLQQTTFTVEEYFALEEQSEVRHEFFEGEVFAMAGESVAHNLLAGNCYLALRNTLRGRPCRVLMENVQLAVQENRHYTYPDVMASCHPDDRRATRMQRHPVLLVEVLSPSTGEYDRGAKFNRYKTLPSLRHYVLVSQQRWLVEWYRRNEADEWTHTALTEADDELFVPELDFRMRLSEVYEDTDVAPLRVLPPAALSEDVE